MGNGGGDAKVGSGGVDILGKGIFEAGDDVLNFPLSGSKDTNVDFVEVGNDKAQAFGWDGWPWAFRNGPAKAENNLEIKKNQDTECNCCNPILAIEESSEDGAETDLFIKDCVDCCPVNNIEKIKVGNRAAQAFGFATATNNIKIVTNQQ
jgi:hypothetical protein